MSISARLAALEAALGNRRCAACAGRPERELLTWSEGEPKPRPERCAACGRVADVVIVQEVLVESREDAERSREADDVD